MKYSFLNKTGVKLSRISLGAMTFGDQVSEAESLDIINYAYDRGINCFDTSDVYSQGESERIVGKGLKGKRHEVILATKVYAQMGSDINDMGLNRRHIMTSIDASLKRLNTDYVDIYYMHKPDHETYMEETLETMNNLVKTGKIRYIGVANFAAWQIANMFAICDKRNYVSPIISQNVYNIITRSLEAEHADFLRTQELALSVSNPLAGGILSGKHKPGKPTKKTRFALKSSYVSRYWNDSSFSAVEKLKKIATRHGVTIIQLALRWLDTQNIVTTITIGSTSLSHIKENIAALDGPLLDQEVLTACDEMWYSLIGNRFAYNR